jgi:uncharacterized protein (TIGR03118 family)
MHSRQTFRVAAAHPGRWRPALWLCGLLLAACGGSGEEGGSALPPAVTLEVQPAQLRLGESARLTWQATSGAVCSAAGGWTGSVPASGQQQVIPDVLGLLVFTLACRTPAGGTHMADSADVVRTVSLSVTPANAYSATQLAADTGIALALDIRLVNPRGLVFGPSTTAWVANNGTSTSTQYDGIGRPQPVANPRTVTLPIAPDELPFAPTGIVFNSSSDFLIPGGATAEPAKFIFAGRNGSLAAWSPGVDVNRAVTVLDNPAAEYTGLALAQNADGNFLYAADFHNGRVDVFDATFHKVAPTGARFAFVDPDLPAGYAPFGIQALNTGASGAVQIYVAYAKPRQPDNRESVQGEGLGLIDVYDTYGRLVRQLILPGGQLNSPWGMALAPSDFGALGNRLLVGNLGDGRINAFGATTGQYSATLSDAQGTPFAVSGLWGIAFGNDANGQPHNTLYYVAGKGDGTAGVFGRIDVGAQAPPFSQFP